MVSEILEFLISLIQIVTITLFLFRKLSKDRTIVEYWYSLTDFGEALKVRMASRVWWTSTPSVTPIFRNVAVPGIFRSINKVKKVLAFKGNMI